jgi:hypothetical protein
MALRFARETVRSRAAVAAAVATCLTAGVSTATSYGSIWSKLSEERARDEALTDDERDRAPVASIPFPVDPFDYYGAFLRPDDRVYFHVLESGFSNAVDLRGVVAAVGRFWLLPAVEVENVEDATVVLSWERDPAELGLRFSEQHRAGQQLFFVSRIAR